VSERSFFRSVVAATVVALLVRVLWPEIRPVHHDESVNWYFISGVLRKGWYDYDPNNYHGPLFFYLSAWARPLFGDALWVLRLPTMLLGAAMVPLAWMLRPAIGDRAASLSGWALAVSPALVFFARDAIHETTLAAASLGAVVFGLRWLQGRARNDALWLGLCLGAMVTTKETFLITGGAWGVGLGLVWITGGRTAWPDWRSIRWVLLGFVLLFVPLYAGFGFHIEGLAEAFQAFFMWGDRGIDGGGHGGPWTRWPGWLGVSDWALVVLGIVGLGAAVVRRDPWAVFVSGWLLSTVAVYSAVSYKTPWCILQAALPLALLAGWGAAWLDRHLIGRIAVVLLLLGGLGQAIDFSFVRPEEPDAPLVYVQTRRELIDTMDVVKAVIEATPDADVVSYQDSRYPMNWLLDRPGLENLGELPDVLDADVLITKPSDRRRVEPLLAGPYRLKATLFRQGLRLHVWISAEHDALVPADWEPIAD
jgi:uncharacterized protein (TIGR03663 family)